MKNCSVVGEPPHCYVAGMLMLAHVDRMFSELWVVGMHVHTLCRTTSMYIELARPHSQASYLHIFIHSYTFILIHIHLDDLYRSSLSLFFLSFSLPPAY